MRKPQRTGKYTPENLLPVLRHFIAARNAAIDLGFTDNSGAIHSVERILDILCQRLRYPHLRHINTLKSDPDAEISEAAYEARQSGAPLRIEHVMPQRAFARKIIMRVKKGASDDSLIAFINKNYRLVVLTPEEARHLDSINRSKLAKDRLAHAEIKLKRPDKGRTSGYQHRLSPRSDT
jgi:hypothetical protein